MIINGEAGLVIPEVGVDMLGIDPWRDDSQLEYSHFPQPLPPGSLQVVRHQDVPANDSPEATPEASNAQTLVAEIHGLASDLSNTSDKNERWKSVLGFLAQFGYLDDAEIARGVDSSSSVRERISLLQLLGIIEEVPADEFEAIRGVPPHHRAFRISTKISK